MSTTEPRVPAAPVEAKPAKVAVEPKKKLAVTFVVAPTGLPFNTGETAGFLPDKARALVSAGVARFYAKDDRAAHEALRAKEEAEADLARGKVAMREAEQLLARSKDQAEAGATRVKELAAAAKEAAGKGKAKQALQLTGAHDNAKKAAAEHAAALKSATEAQKKAAAELEPKAKAAEEAAARFQAAAASAGWVA